MPRPLLLLRTTNAADTLLARATDPQKNTSIGEVNSIRIANTSTNSADVSLFYDNAAGVDHFIFKNVIIPKGVTLYIEEDLDFDRKAHDLKITNEGTGPSLTIIIK